MFSRLITASVLALPIIGSAATLPPRDKATSTVLGRSRCRPMCCDALINSVSPGGEIGINCSPGGLDCGFSGQIDACCVRISPLGLKSGTGIGCVSAREYNTPDPY
ncbi:hypothetical protein X797_011912 [Metarhizium robertsii]|uniref:Hydrophobin n=1 Tax=Metarhizium robertsii TaxID=568076 RepID=A0A0A1UMN2_9HYPO|nr:hypothetical protein X797_011912 [Metarhizium robertsii]